MLMCVAIVIFTVYIIPLFEYNIIYGPLGLTFYYYKQYVINILVPVCWISVRHIPSNKNGV